MSQQPQVTQQKPQQPKPPRIQTVFFKEAASFNSGSLSASIGRNYVESLVPGSISSTGTPARADDDGDRPSDGILVTLRQQIPGSKVVLRTSLVPWDNIRDVLFEDVEIVTPAASQAA